MNSFSAWCEMMAARYTRGDLEVTKNDRKMKMSGLHKHRLDDNPEERRFAEAWHMFGEATGHLGHLLDQRPEQTGRPPSPSDRDFAVAATVIQWLGSPVGQNWLRDLGYVRKGGAK